MGDILTHYEKNTEGRDFVIGDLHGCYDDFMALMDELSFDKEVDRMFSVGDLIDRGPKSMECLRLIEEPWFHCVRGNHEDMMIIALTEFGTGGMWHQNGGSWSYHPEIDEEELKRLAGLAAQLPLAMTVDTDHGKVGICHAEAPKDWSSIGNGMGRDSKYRMIWGRTKINHRDEWHSENIDYTIHGHTPILTPVTLGNSIYIDTGICFKGMEIIGREDPLDGKLTYVRLDDINEYAKQTNWPKVLQELKKQGKGIFD